jgi:hypothetical protein
MHRLVITRAYYQVGPLISHCKIQFTTGDGGLLDWDGFVNGESDPVSVEVPGDGQLSIEHSQFCTVSITSPERLMRTRKITFPVVEVKPSKSGVCPVCSKKVSRKGSFFQTLNPFNTNTDGSQKTRQQILAELDVKVAAWKLEPVFHVKCEDLK